MKFLIVTACIFAVAAAQYDDVRDRFKHAISECKDVVGASDVDVDDYDNRILPKSTVGKCMIACINKKNKIQDENGKIDPELSRAAAHVILQKMEISNEDLYEKVLKIYFTCIDQASDGPDECEIAAQYFVCFSEGLNDAGFPKILN